MGLWLGMTFEPGHRPS